MTRICCERSGIACARNCSAYVVLTKVVACAHSVWQVGAKGASESQARSLHALLEDHGLVKVKINMAAPAAADAAQHLASGADAVLLQQKGVFVLALMGTRTRSNRQHIAVCACCSHTAAAQGRGCVQPRKEATTAATQAAQACWCVWATGSQLFHTQPRLLYKSICAAGCAGAGQVERLAVGGGGDGRLV